MTKAIPRKRLVSVLSLILLEMHLEVIDVGYIKAAEPLRS